MALIRLKSQAEQDIDALEAGMLRIGESLTHPIAALSQEHARFWGLPTERLLELMNALGPEKVAAVFAANRLLAESVNASLDALGSAKFPSRAPVEPGREDIVFDPASGLFVHVPAEEPMEPEPDTDEEVPE